MLILTYIDCNDSKNVKINVFVTNQLNQEQKVLTIPISPHDLFINKYWYCKTKIKASWTAEVHSKNKFGMKNVKLKPRRSRAI